MKAKKPLLVAALVLTLLAVALILPAAAVASGDDYRAAWVSWGQDIKHVTVVPVPDTDPPEIFELPWEATFRVTVFDWGSARGYEYMNWITPELPPFVPPIGEHLTTDIYSMEFTRDLETGLRQATIVFQFDIGDWGYPFPSIWHKFVLTDAPFGARDHAAIYSQSWEPGHPPEGSVDWQSPIWEDDTRCVRILIW